MSVEQKLKEYTSKLAEINKSLKTLEKEKQEIIKAYNEADEKEKENITNKMKESEEKFKELCDSIFELYAKVKKLKKQC